MFGASTIARIIGLVVIGATFYAGGMLYQRLLANNESRSERIPRSGSTELAEVLLRG